MLTTLLFLLLVNVASAANTEITVKTVVNYDITINILGATEKYEFFKSFHENAGPTGKVTVVYPGEQEAIDIIVKVTQGKREVLKERFEEYVTGKQYYIEMVPGFEATISEGGDPALAPVEPEETVEEPEEPIESPEETVEETTEDTSAGITGNAVSKVGDFFSNSTVYFTIIGLVVGLVVIFFVIKKVRTSQSPNQINIRKLGKSPQLSQSEISTRQEIIEAEKRIKEAQAQINKLKNEDRIKQIEQRIANEKAELDKLQRGEL